MWQEITSTFNSWCAYYASTLKSEWSHMTPTKYGILLIGIFGVGWLMLKSGMKKP